MNVKPPIGLVPRFVRDEQRRIEIQNAITRYLDAGIRIPTDWITEYNELVAKEDAN
ncbi:hypothetical protein [Paenibacillus abyssi]|uniref:Uncharacterized protein n=1 Tax=Paenibacillus abyssi TaxID=1340531 RepID=A0A917CH21_9BACL|nr:hypothetical protein [Paenibacillus abyssi]GGF88271.1 hypothetical protein GCM10010916_01980 [Paenibacillus abyssi]